MLENSHQSPVAGHQSERPSQRKGSNLACWSLLSACSVWPNRVGRRYDRPPDQSLVPRRARSGSRRNLLRRCVRTSRLRSCLEFGWSARIWSPRRKRPAGGQAPRPEDRRQQRPQLPPGPAGARSCGSGRLLHPGARVRRTLRRSTGTAAPVQPDVLRSLRARPGRSQDRGGTPITLEDVQRMGMIAGPPQSRSRSTPRDTGSSPTSNWSADGTPWRIIAAAYSPMAGLVLMPKPP